MRDGIEVLMCDGASKLLTGASPTVGNVGNVYDLSRQQGVADEHC